MKLLRAYFADFGALLFPELCAACQASLVAGERIMCSNCHFNLPFTNFHQQPANIVAQQFWGKINIEAAYALYYFHKGGKIQSLMHHFKYKGMPQIGNLLGNVAGGQLVENAIFNTADVIIPVPLHKSRLRERGYNQSACFAQGLAQKLTATVDEHSLIRTKATKTQTQRSRFARFENMQHVFAVNQPRQLENKHILLVDDIVTTGSTLEACGAELLKIPGVKLSIATIAYAV